MPPVDGSVESLVSDIWETPNLSAAESA
jgi:hypothetical protein